MNDLVSMIRAGDTVIVEGDLRGKVLFWSAQKSYLQEYPLSDWPLDEYDGMMILQSNGALIFYRRELIESGDAKVELVD